MSTAQVWEPWSRSDRQGVVLLSHATCDLYPRMCQQVLRHLPPDLDCTKHPKHLRPTKACVPPAADLAISTNLTTSDTHSAFIPTAHECSRAEQMSMYSELVCGAPDTFLLLSSPQHVWSIRQLRHPRRTINPPDDGPTSPHAWDRPMATLTHFYVNVTPHDRLCPAPSQRQLLAQHSIWSSTCPNR